MDVRRAAGAAALGAFFSGLVYPRVYAVLDARWPGTTARAVCSKTAADIALLGTVGNSFSIGCRLRIGGEQLPEVLVALRDTMPAVLLNELRVWLPCDPRCTRDIRERCTRCNTRFAGRLALRRPEV